MDVALFQHDMDDSIVKVNGFTVMPHTFNQLLANNIGFTAQDSQGVTDYCQTISSGTSLNVEVAPVGGGAHYFLTAQPFVGGRPPDR